MSAALKLPERRVIARMPIRVKVEYGAIEDFLIDYTANVALGGIFIQTEEPMAVGATFKLRLSIPNRQRPIDTVGVVRWVVSNSEAGPLIPGMGVQFDQLNPADLRAVQRLLAEW
jgi:uncharacterized protein (TIGR02266 family)